jgi:hypothetical protein
MGTPVAVEILSTLAARDATAPNTRMNAATITVNSFIGDCSFTNTGFDSGAGCGSLVHHNYLSHMGIENLTPDL